MVDTSKILTDDHEDEVFDILRDMDGISGWKKEKVLLKEKLLKLLKKKRYISFWASNPKTYGIGQIGESYLYDVPMFIGGHLKKFRGKRVRILCTGSASHHWREISAGIVGDTPKEYLITSNPQSYNFPAFINDHEVIYSSPRFKVIKIKPRTIYSSKEQSIKYSDLKGWDYMVVDGKVECAIGLIRPSNLLQFETSGLKPYGWSWIRNHETLKEAIDYLKYTRT